MEWQPLAARLSPYQRAYYYLLCPRDGDRILVLYEDESTGYQLLVKQRCKSCRRHPPARMVWENLEPIVRDPALAETLLRAAARELESCQGDGKPQPVTFMKEHIMANERIDRDNSQPNGASYQSGVDPRMQMPATSLVSVVWDGMTTVGGVVMFCLGAGLFWGMSKLMGSVFDDGAEEEE